MFESLLCVQVVARAASAILVSEGSGMTTVTRVATLLAAGMLVAQPCAASDFLDAQAMQRQSSTFAGLNVRLPLGHAQRSKPTARLQFTASHSYRDQRTGTTQTVRAPGLEIGGSKGGKPALYLNGQNTAEMQEKLRLSGSTPNEVWIVLGVGLVAVVVLLAASGPILPRSPIPE